MAELQLGHFFVLDLYSNRQLRRTVGKGPDEGPGPVRNQLVLRRSDFNRGGVPQLSIARPDG